MTINRCGIILGSCPLCGRDVEINSGSIECACGLSLRIDSGTAPLQEWIDEHWNTRASNKDPKYKDAWDYLEMCLIKGIDIPKEVLYTLHELV